MLIFWAGWQPEMSLRESAQMSGSERMWSLLEIIYIFLVSQVSTMGQKRYNPCPRDIKSVQQCIQCKIQVSYRMWLPGTGFSVSSHSAAALSKCIAPYKIQSTQRSFKGRERMSHRRLGGDIMWVLILTLIVYVYVYRKYTQLNFTQFYWTAVTVPS